MWTQNEIYHFVANFLLLQKHGDHFSRIAKQLKRKFGNIFNKDKTLSTLKDQGV